MIPTAPSLESLMAQVADEFLDRLARGEAPAVEEYADKYPQIAGFIRQMFPTLAVLRGGDDPGADEDGEPRRLGDFRILREVGRGGMGVVYEAEQISLGRRVALKVLPFASALDQRQLQRFKTEAQAAGQLHHTHIVPVYFVGEDRGVHFYAMQFIDGRTVADLIADLRKDAAPAPAGESTPPRNALSTLRSGRKPEYYRWVAECGVQAAEALDHAHAHGVVHRDIKPANLIRDHAGQVWVTDFGLAQVRSDVRLTATGDVVGTLRYMSPEQALRPNQVDHRSDVYSLGVTLYELLTLRPAFPAEGREELLRQIADRDPPAARTADRAIPAELDVILRKAMAKEPDERYATANDFAADLRRFLDNRPILAKPPTVWQSAKKWARRHRQIVTTAVIGVFVALAGSTGVLLAKNAEVRAERQNVTDKNELLEKEIADHKLTAKKFEAAADLAVANFGEFQRAVVRMLERGRWEFPASPAVLRQRRQLCQDIVKLLDGLDDDLKDGPAVHWMRAVALSQEAFATFMLGDTPRAVAAFAEAETLFGGLVEADPRDTVYRQAFGWMLNYKAMSLVLDRQIDAANAYWDRAVDHLRAGLATNPKDAECRLVLSETIYNFDTTRNRGTQVRRPETLADALALADGLHADFPDHPGYHFQQARLRTTMAGRRAAADPATAVAEIMAALPDLRALVAGHPLDLPYRRELARSLGGMALTLFKLDRKPEAEAAYREALAQSLEVARLVGNSASEHADLAQVAVSLANLLGPTGPKAAEAGGHLETAVRALETAVLLETDSAGHDYYQRQLHDRSLLLARSLAAQGKLPAAADAVARAARNEPTDPKAAVAVAQHYGLLARKVLTDAAIPEAKRPAAAEPYHYQALAALRRAADRGFKDWAAVRGQPVFAGIKDTAEFKALTGEK